jgi:hypothetical protein
MHSNLWGQFAWYIIHTLALHYIENKNDYYVDFYESLRNVLPCEICRGHYYFMISQNGKRTNQNSSKNSIHPWTVRLHNEVNQRLNKHTFTDSQSVEHYKNYDHNKLFIFIDLMTKLGIKKNTPDRISGLRKMLRSITELFPCESCRNSLINFQSTNSIESTGSLENWINEWKKLLHQHINYQHTQNVINELFHFENQRQNHLQKLQRIQNAQRNRNFIHHPPIQNQLQRPPQRLPQRPLQRPPQRAPQRAPQKAIQNIHPPIRKGIIQKQQPQTILRIIQQQRQNIQRVGNQPIRSYNIKNSRPVFIRLPLKTRLVNIQQQRNKFIQTHRNNTIYNRINKLKSTGKVVYPARIGLHKRIIGKK